MEKFIRIGESVYNIKYLKSMVFENDYFSHNSRILVLKFLKGDIVEILERHLHKDFDILDTKFAIIKLHREICDFLQNQERLFFVNLFLSEFERKQRNK